MAVNVVRFVMAEKKKEKKKFDHIDEATKFMNE